MTQREDSSPDIDADETFVQRWSRRKHDAAQAPPATQPTAVEPAAQQSESGDETSAPEAPGDEDMPSLDSIGQDSDISAFFSPRVSEGLRQAALQRVFRQPRFNYQDGLDVYCENYRNFKPLGDIVTAAMRHRLEVARERLARLTEQGDADPMADRGPSDNDPAVEQSPDSEDGSMQASTADPDARLPGQNKDTTNNDNGHA